MIAGYRLPPRQQAGASGSTATRIRQIAGADAHRAARRHAVSRSELFATLYLLAVANALAGVVLSALRSDDPYPALADVLNLGTLAATAVGIHLLRQMPDAAARRCDWVLAAIVGALLLVPHHSAGWLAVLGVALYAIGRDRQSVPAVASGSIFLLLAASSYWGPVLAQAFGSSLLALDAALAAAVLDVLADGDVDRVENLIITRDQTMLVMFWCSFLPNLLHGCLWYSVIARAIRPAWQAADLLALLAVGGLVLTVNTVRLALMGLSAQSYQWVHGPVGGNVFNIGLLLVIATIALYSTAPAAAPLRRRRSASRRGEPVG
jgi:hypothetical protein